MLDKTPVVRVEHLSKHFGSGTARVDALRDINMDVYPGQVVGLMGPSGSGKTTLLNCIACIMEPSSGRLTLDGEVVYDEHWLRADLRRLRLDKVGFIFQYPNLLPFLDGTDNVAVVLSLAGYSSAAARVRAVDLLNYLEVGHRKHAMPVQLSGGEAQRVAIARALANKPRIILADEPTAPLDSARARIVMDLLRRIAVEQSAAIIVVTHDEMILDRFDHIFSCAMGDWRLRQLSNVKACSLFRCSFNLSKRNARKWRLQSSRKTGCLRPFEPWLSSANLRRERRYFGWVTSLQVSTRSCLVA